MDLDLAKTRLVLKGLIADAQRASAAELEDLEARLDDAQELNGALIADLSQAIAALAARVTELTAALTKLRDRAERLRGYGGGGASSSPFDLATLPAANPTITPEQIVVKQSGVWVRMDWAAFISLVRPPTGGVLELYADDYATSYTLSLDGDDLSLS